MQLEFFDVPSPCVSVCETDEKGLCLGCFRNREERLNWINLTSNDKQKVIKRCKQRKKRKDALVNEKATTKQDEQPENDIIQPSLLDPPIKIKKEQNSDLDFEDFEL